MRSSLVLGILLSGTLAAGSDRDGDGDGISDVLERSLAERFAPQFQLDVNECADKPAEFRADTAEPRVLARNGTIYTKVSPSVALGPDRVAATVTYFHLWDRDCGPLSPHPLDVEHVSALIVAPTMSSRASEWTALYWYAAAHENTVCDTSNAASARVIGAAANGPRVWVAKGKHASYLSPELCSERGCGVDSCSDMVAMPSGRLVDLGEADAPADDAPWIMSTRWPLGDKLRADFDPVVAARIDIGDETVLARVNGQWRPQHFSLSVGSDILHALGKAEDGLQTADKNYTNAIDKSFLAVGGALTTAAKAIWPR